MRLKAGAIAAEPIPVSACPGLLADREAGEAADDDVLAGRRRELVSQLLHGLALELRVVHLLLEQHDRRQPRVELAGDDFLPHVLGLVRRLLLVDPGLSPGEVRRHVLPADVFHGRRGGDLHRHLAGERDEVVVLGDEVGVAVHLDQHAHLGAGVHVGLDRPLRGGSLAEVLDLLALLHAQDLDRLVDVPLGLGEGLLAVHHPRAGALPQGLHVLRCDLGRVHHAFVSAFVSSVVSVGASAPGGSASGAVPALASSSASAAGVTSAAGADSLAGASATAAGAGGTGVASAAGAAGGATAGVTSGSAGAGGAGGAGAGVASGSAGAGGAGGAGAGVASGSAGAGGAGGATAGDP